MKRTVARQIAVQLGFSWAVTDESPEEILENFFDPEYYDQLASEDEMYREKPEDQKEYIATSLRMVAEHKDELDAYIERFSNGWKVHRINSAAVAVMRQAMVEMLYMNDIPPAACMNEAVEITKGYAEEETVSFVNGILGSFYREVIEKSGPSGENENV